MGKAFAPGVAELLVEDLLRDRTIGPGGETMEVVGQYVEPLQLQVVGRTLWNGLATDTMVITGQDLQRFGDANQPLLAFYEEVIRQVAAQQVAVREEKLRDWFEHNLITPAGTRGTVFCGRRETAGLPNAAVTCLKSPTSLGPRSELARVGTN